MSKYEKLTGEDILMFIFGAIFAAIWIYMCASKNGLIALENHLLGKCPHYYEEKIKQTGERR